MKSKLSILMVLFILFGASNVSAQNPGELVYMSDSFSLDPAPPTDLSAEFYQYDVDDDVEFGGCVNITEVEPGGVASIVQVLLLNEENRNKFRDSNGRGVYEVVFQVDVFEDNGTVFWDAAYDVSMGEIVYFVYWYMEPTSRESGGQVEVYIEMWDYAHHTPTHTVITYPTNTTTTTTDTTTTTTDTTTDEVEDNLFIYLLLGTLGGIGVIVIYMVVRPKKVKYVWENK